MARSVLEFAVLGALEVRRQGRVVALGGAKARAVLSVLLLHRNEAVSADRLAMAVWGEDAPAGAVKAVQVHISRLRRALGEPGPVATTPLGYRLVVAPGAVDAERFERLLEQARAAAPGRAWGLLEEALGLWRGEPWAELVDGQLAQAPIARLQELRLAAVEARADAAVALGRDVAVIAELQALAVEHPAREDLTRRLMLALYRAGRHAEALDAFQRTSAHLRDQLGLEPSPALRQVEQAVLVHDPALGNGGSPEARTRSQGHGGVEIGRAGGAESRVQTARQSPAAAPEPRPQGSDARLPLAPNATVGRDGEVDAIVGRLGSGDVRLLTLIGPGGVGKMRLALEVARAARRLRRWRVFRVSGRR